MLTGHPRDARAFYIKKTWTRPLSVCYTYGTVGDGRGLTAKTFRCADAGVVCNAKVTGETEEEVLAKAVEHAQKAHGVDLSKSITLAGYARSLIRDDPS